MNAAAPGQVAEWYARHLGWAVFPAHSIREGHCTCGEMECKSPGKHPLTPNGVLDATKDPARIKEFWMRSPSANICVATGTSSGIGVLDVDPRHCGDESLFDFERQHGELPATVISLTGGGGSHLFFRHVEGSKNSSSEIAPGLDWKTTGGYVVLPPSVHMSGRPYQWEGASRPDEAKIVDAPKWLLDKVLARQNGNGHHASPVAEEIPEGQRNKILLSLAGSMRRRGLGAIEIEAALTSVNQNRCKPPLALDEIRAIAASIVRYTPAAPMGQRLDQKESALPRLISAKDLYEGQTVTLRPLFEDLLWDGLTMFVARPKAGKSFLTLQLAVQVAGGRAVPGVTALAYGPVLYAALEEPQARTMGRLRKIAPMGDWAENLHFVYELLPLMGGGSEQLAALIERLRPRLVILDTFTALVKTGTKNGSDVFRSQYAEVSRLRKLAEDYKTAINVVHHVRKGMSDGAIEAVAGTGGIAAAVDTVWLLKRKPEGEATLDVVGRETEEKTYALRFDQDPFGWRVLGDDALQLLNAERRQILDLLREEGGQTPAQIAAEIGKSRPAVRMLLKRMREDNQVQKQGTKYIPTLTVSYRVTE